MQMEHFRENENGHEMGFVSGGKVGWDIGVHRMMRNEFQSVRWFLAIVFCQQI